MWYNIDMKKKTHITLHNGKSVTLKLTSDDYHFYITALDENQMEVGKCQFNIEKMFKEQTDSNSFQRIVRLNVALLDKYNAQGNTYIRYTGEVFCFDKTITTLNSINILHADYFKVGLGTAMLKEVEKLSRLYNASHIEGFYNPNGKFAHGAEKFYKNHGFIFDNKSIPNLTLITKPLQKIATHSLVDTNQNPHSNDNPNM